MFNHESFLFEGLLANCAQNVLRWVDFLMCLFVTVEITFAAEKFSANSTDELLSRSRIQISLGALWSATHLTLKNERNSDDF